MIMLYILATKKAHRLVSHHNSNIHHNTLPFCQIKSSNSREDGQLKVGEFGSSSQRPYDY